MVNPSARTGFRTALVLSCVLLAGLAIVAQDAPALKSIVFELQGRLLAIRIETTSPVTEYTVGRQGYPEKRDLVVTLPGFTSAIERVEGADAYRLPIEITREGDGKAALKVVLGYVGDSLVQVAHKDGSLSILVIAPEARSETVDAYLIGPDDLLQIDVFGHEDLNKTLKVSPGGMIQFPLIGAVVAEGRTVDDLAKEITERLASEYLQDPHVTVSIWEYQSKWVNIIGEVVRPGRYYMTGTTTLLDALSEAGGLASGAGSEILVARRADQSDPADAGEVFHVKIDQLFSSEGARLNLRLKSGDIVNVQGGASTPGS